MCRDYLVRRGRALIEGVLLSVLMELRVLGLDYLKERLEPESPVDPEAWYQDFRESERARLFPYLVESAGKVSRVFIIEQEDEGLVKVTLQDVVASKQVGGCPESAVPFIKPSGSQSASIGPVIKRTWSTDKGAGPSDKIIKTTLKSFQQMADSSEPWASYFGEVLGVLSNPIVRMHNGTTLEWGKNYENLLSAVIDQIGPQPQTVFLTIRTLNGQLPGDDERYIRYLFEAILAGERYTTANTPAQQQSVCSLCGHSHVTIYSNGIKGAGINILNSDRIGVFPNLAVENAWKRYAICQGCADLLFITKAHVLKKSSNGRQPFGSRIAGASALVIPTFSPNIAATIRGEIMAEIRRYVDDTMSDVAYREDGILDLLKDEQSILSFHIIWADIGQNIENISGSIMQVLPSRLRQLSLTNQSFADQEHALFPQALQNQEGLSIDLNLRILHSLFYRPGPHGKSLNKSAQLQKFKRTIAEAVYHANPLSEQRWQEELVITARAYFDEAVQETEGFKSFLYEWQGKNEQMSAARWIKYINQLRAYLEKVGVFRMAEQYFEPVWPRLKPYFGPESGIDSEGKAYAFVLGILFGKLLQIQGARKVNVSANALTWLKRLTLKGTDLPGLYVKIREKLLVYEAESNPDIRDILQEFARLAVPLGDNIRLDDVKTTYYLLLGQSVSHQVLPSKEKEKI